MSIISTKYSTLRINTKEILKEVELAELSRRRRAAQYAAKEMKKNVNMRGKSTPGSFPARFTGDLFRSIGYQLDKADRSAIVGSKSFKAHLLEFGHGDGKTQNRYPFVVPSLLKAEGEIIKIMSERYF